MSTEKNQWGGKRIPGPGKRLGLAPVLKDAVRVTIWIPAAQLAWIKAQGKPGEVIRQLVDEAMKDKEK